MYATFSGPPGREAMRWAAVLACGQGAVLSHWTAAEIWGLPDAARQAEADEPIHVTIPSGRYIIAPAGVALHYSSRLGSSRHPAKSPPCTRVEDTVVDLTQSTPGIDAAISVITGAVRQRLTTYEKLLESFTARKKLRWREELTMACALAGQGVHSLLEHRFLTRVERPHGLPPMQRQARWEHSGRSVFVDALNQDHRLRVELDGRAGHTDQGAFRDMWRDNAAALAGDTTLRFGWDDVTSRPCETAALLAKIYIDRGHHQQLTTCGPACTALPTLRRLLTTRNLADPSGSRAP
ncbi:hypothetical protein DPM19_06945 [Actinomadura craniellae]|uniref:DUF559 domain-containing protein n=1 Tax=Actinomadura craniellae TaxID=2231787 RepID=A0A365H939_9ACTN|nr:hypothetical protein DPM19_06945 [Actinomadura craniellae]